METIKDQKQVFKNLLSVLTWLQAHGWQISRSGLYKHHGEGKLRKRDDGHYHLKDVEKYALTFLKLKATGKRVQRARDELQQQKAALEVKKLDLEIARAEHKKKVEEGAYIPREQIELELVSRAAVLDAGLTHFFQSQASAWIHLVGGDQRKLPELLGVLATEKDKLLHQYAAPIEFTVEFTSESIEHLESQTEIV